MGLRTKLNLLLLFAAGLGAVALALLVTPYLNGLAAGEVEQSSRIMMMSAAGTRKYTSQQVAPLLLDRMQDHFYPQAVSAYAAVKAFDVLHAQFRNYSYREPALNPTNPMDRAEDWESDIIQAFRSDPSLPELVRVRQAMDGPTLELARPIRTDPACLACHSTPQVAPKSMIAVYGSDHGFGWKPNEIVAAQIVSVPMKLAYDRAAGIRNMALAVYLAVILVVALVLNLGLQMLVMGPVKTMSRIAEDVSMARGGAPEFVPRGNDEIAGLGASFNRMRRSLEEAMRLLTHRSDGEA
jgi:HAMP domain-containing protein